MVVSCALYRPERSSRILRRALDSCPSGSVAVRISSTIAIASEKMESSVVSLVSISVAICSRVSDIDSESLISASSLSLSSRASCAPSSVRSARRASNRAFRSLTT